MLHVPLRDVMTQGYLYVEEHQPTEKALGVMRDMHISCIFVLRNGVTTGIITERGLITKALTSKDLYTSTASECMTRPLLSLTPENTIIEACDFMRKHEIRHLGIVDDHGNLKGTVTPGNIVNFMATESFSSTALVENIMFTSLALVDENATLKDVAASMRENRTCCAVIMKERHPLGLISEKDVTRCLGYGQDVAKIRVDRIMTQPVISVAESASIAEAILTLRKHHIHRVIVCDQGGKISGILSLNCLMQNIRKINN